MDRGSTKGRLDTNDPRQVRRARTTARRILKRAEGDAEFRRRAAGDPAGVLAEYGLPEGAIRDFIRETTARPGLAAGPEHDCHDFTCIISVCPVTCFVTIEPLPPSV
jgi:hypothetical protein